MKNKLGKYEGRILHVAFLPFYSFNMGRKKAVRFLFVRGWRESRYNINWLRENRID